MTPNFEILLRYRIQWNYISGLSTFFNILSSYTSDLYKTCAINYRLWHKKNHDFYHNYYYIICNQVLFTSLWRYLERKKCTKYQTNIYVYFWWDRKQMIGASNMILGTNLTVSGPFPSDCFLKNVSLKIICQQRSEKNNSSSKFCL